MSQTMLEIVSPAKHSDVLKSCVHCTCSLRRIGSSFVYMKWYDSIFHWISIHLLASLFIFSFNFRVCRISYVECCEFDPWVPPDANIVFTEISFVLFDTPDCRHFAKRIQSKNIKTNSMANRIHSSPVHSVSNARICMCSSSRNIAQTANTQLVFTEKLCFIYICKTTKWRCYFHANVDLWHKAEVQVLSIRSKLLVQDTRANSGTLLQCDSNETLNVEKILWFHSEISLCSEFTIATVADYPASCWNIRLLFFCLKLLWKRTSISFIQCQCIDK